MKSRLHLIWAAIAVVATINLCLGFYTDTVDYLTFQQPNEVSFQARYWGDEFEWHMESSDGYAIIYNGADHYYYYAQLNSAGEYCCTDLKVNIDSPEGLPLHLDRSAERKAQIQAAIDQFMSDAELAREWFIAWQDTSSREFLNVGVFLVELADKQTENEFTIDDFERMLSSVNEYNTYLSQGQVQSPDPERAEDVCGSVRDYYNEVSGGRFYPLYSVINPPDPLDPTKPVWLELSGNLASYALWSLITATINAAVDSGWLGLMQGYDDICVIIADHFIWGEPGPLGDVLSGYTNSQMPGVSGAYIMWEEWGDEFNLYDPFTFSHIGCHCHIYGHMLGLSFTYIGGNNSAGQFMLMGTGNNPGPRFKGESPSHMGIAEKFEKNWINLSGPNQELFDITENYVGANELVIPYRADGHRWYYRFPCPNCPQTDDVFFLENRRYDGQGLPWPNGQDFNSYLIGHDNPACPRNMLLIHRCWNAWPGLSYYDYGDFLCADNQIDYTDPYHHWWLGDWGDPFPGIDGIDSLSPLSPDVTEIDPQWPGGQHAYHTTPKDHFGRQTGFALFNIRSETDGIHADVYHNYWAGEIISSTVWYGDDIIVGGPGISLINSPTNLTILPQSVVEFREGTKIQTNGNYVILQSDIERDFFIEGNLKIDDDITVRDCATLTIYPGSQVRFAPGKKLTIEGRLIAIGTQQDPIAFCRYGAAQYEGTIIDHTGLSPTLDSEIKYCTIIGARVGVLARATSKLVVEHCEITDNVYGIYGSTTGATLAPKIKYNTISDNSVYGIAMYGMGASGVIAHNTISGNSSGGVYLHDSSPGHYGYNDHRGPTVFGLLCESSSSPHLQIPVENSGCNDFGNGGSCDYGVIIRDESRPYMGWVSGGYSHPGNNDLYAHNQYLLDHRGNQYIWAQHNWWDGRDPELPPPLITNRELVDTYEWQEGDPIPPDGLMGPGSGGSFKESVGQVDALPPLLLQADQLLAAANYTSAAALYLAALSANPTIANGLWAVWGFNQANSLLNISPSFLSQLNGISAQFANNQIGIYAQYLVMLHLSGINPGAALVMATNLSSQNLYPELAMHSAFRAAMLNKYALGNLSVANAQFEQLISAYPGEDLTNLAYLELGMLPPGIGGGRTDEVQFSPQEFRFDVANPNPFNPATVLSYQLPVASRVSLRVYDTAGRLVTELVNGWREAGAHQITFDGSGLPSGIYFAKLKAGDYSQVQKLVLMK